MTERAPGPGSATGLGDAVLRTSPLHDRHLALGAKTAAFSGWEMPLEYAGGGVLKEHIAVRESVGVFDVSHLGKAVVTGPAAADFVNSCLTNDLRKIAPGQAQYTLCCDAATGGVVDDLIAYLRRDSEIFLIPNAANTTEVVWRLSSAAPPSIEVRNQHRDFAVLAVQGPRSDETLAAVGLPVGHDYMSFVEAEHSGQRLTVCRTGYTGERGYELVVRRDAAAALWDAVLEAGSAYGIRPCGLGARDTLRTEMGYPLHGQDIALDISPVQARLGWAVGWQKDAFWGRSVLTAEKAAGPSRVLRGLLATGRGIPRPHLAVAEVNGRVVGSVTSGTFSPTLRQGIGLALLDAGVKEGDEVSIDLRGRSERFAVVRPPFVEADARS